MLVIRDAQMQILSTQDVLTCKSFLVNRICQEALVCQLGMSQWSTIPPRFLPLNALPHLWPLKHNVFWVPEENWV